MDETNRRQVSITRELMTWAYAMPRLIGRIDDVPCLPRITRSQMIEAESIRQRIRVVLSALHAAVEADEEFERLTANMDRLREEIAAADVTLDRICMPN
jgi:hypothetical protein